MSLIFRAMWRLSSCSAPAAPASSAPCAKDDRRRQHSDCQSVSRLFTATIFACTTGIAVAAISVPMLLIQLTLAACAAIIMPLTTPMMLADFSAVGGMLLVATGLRICGIKCLP